jgi:NADH-quinone oxidoreductase subunit K
MPVSIEPLLILSAFLFCVGLVIMITKRHIIIVLMGVELILNAANLNLVIFSQYDAAYLQGQIFALFVMVVAAAEAAVGLAILILVYRYFKTANLDEISKMKG